MEESASELSPPDERAHGEIRAEISRRMVQFHKDFYGKGPEKAKTYYHDDSVLILLRGGFTKVEETLLEAGHGGAVIGQRMKFQEVMQGRFAEMITEVTGRRVIAFMGGSYQRPDIISEVFILEPTDLIPEAELDLPSER